MKFAALFLVLAAATLSSATILSISSGNATLGNHGSNLITNGSFEADYGLFPNLSYWATGTSLSPTIALTGWNASGQVGSYALWGNSTPGTLEGSDTIPDGQMALYFGGGIMGPPSVTPTYQANGIVTFASTPTFFPKPSTAPVKLSQTVSGLNVSQTYLLDFWASGEDATGGQFTQPGFFGLDITGEATNYFMAPINTSSVGASVRYYTYFKPSASTVTLTWTNWGHYFDAAGSHSELVMDDVILNAVPEPCTMFALGGAALALLRRKRKAIGLA